MENTVNGALLRLKVLQIGLGRFGLHLNKHLKESSFFDVTSVKNEDELKNENINFKDFEYIFLTTPDSVIEEYINNISKDVKVVHFSGFYHHPNALGIHPLQSFSKIGEIDLKSVLYVVDGDLDENLKSLFLNRAFIKGENKKIYHTYISTTANSLQLLMNKIGKDFEKDTGISKNFLKKIVINSLERELLFEEESFSGPWTRGEEKNQFEIIGEIESLNLKNLSFLFKKLLETERKRRML